jgi:hypothetical protein
MKKTAKVVWILKNYKDTYNGIYYICMELKRPKKYKDYYKCYLQIGE